MMQAFAKYVHLRLANIFLPRFEGMLYISAKSSSTLREDPEKLVFVRGRTSITNSSNALPKKPLSKLYLNRSFVNL